MGERKRKRDVICLSSDEEEEDEDEEEDEEESDENSSDSSHSCYGSDSSEDEENEVSDDARNVKDESLCNRVDRLLQGGRDLEGLNLKECKAYLRRYSLRLSGTKAVCIMRIQEHWRIRDGNGEALYPRSSFVINCTGDVCKGDVVLFIQRVYQQNGKMKRRGKCEGKRTVAGRVVKESYGAAKQQHTFTVEVLWSKGIQKLPSLYPLLVKGRNLYKLKTFRQRWGNEAERSKVLAEKHKRGAAARLVREKRKTKRARPADGGVNSRKHLHDAIPSQTRRKNEAKKKKKHVRQGKAINHERGKPTSHQENPSSNSRHVNHTQTYSPRTYKSSRNQNQTTLYRDSFSTRQLFADPPRNPYQSQIRFHHQSAPYHMPSHHLAPNPATLAPFRPHGITLLEPPTRQYRVLDHDHSSYTNVGRPVHRFPLRNNRQAAQLKHKEM